LLPEFCKPAAFAAETERHETFDIAATGARAVMAEYLALMSLKPLRFCAMLGAWHSGANGEAAAGFAAVVIANRRDMWLF
jgi:hypothetical protein